MKSSLKLRYCYRGVESSNSFLSLQEGEKPTLGCNGGEEGNTQNNGNVFDIATAKAAVFKHFVTVYLDEENEDLHIWAYLAVAYFSVSCQSKED